MEYEINYDTQIIMPVGDNSSKIIESDEEYFVKKSVQNIMEHSCEYFGSSFEGRQSGTLKLVGYTHKVPIIVEESRDIIFFPTLSPKNGKCSWVSYKHVYRPDKFKDKAIIEFKNGKKVVINASTAIIDNQLYRCSRLKDTLDVRKNAEK